MWSYTHLLVEEVLSLTKAAQLLLVLVMSEALLVRHSEVVDECSEDARQVPLQMASSYGLFARQNPGGCGTSLHGNAHTTEVLTGMVRARGVASGRGGARARS